MGRIENTTLINASVENKDEVLCEARGFWLVDLSEIREFRRFTAIFVGVDEGLSGGGDGGLSGVGGVLLEGRRIADALKRICNDSRRND